MADNKNKVQVNNVNVLASHRRRAGIQTRVLPATHFWRYDADRFQARYGRQDMKAYDGLKAFLFLEGDKAGQADPVEASELANLLLTSSTDHDSQCLPIGQASGCG